MSQKTTLFEKACRSVIIGVVREESYEDARDVALAYARNGLDLIEITFTTPNAPALIEGLASEFGAKVTIAAGSLRSGNDAAVARRAGASILVSPHTDLRVIEYGAENQLLVISGASTPTEIITAWERGADIVKVYPAMHLGGPAYIRTIRQPIRDVPMLAGGPVALDQIEAYLDAGAVALNLGGSLAVPELVRNKDWEEIGKRVILARSIVKSWRASRQSTEVVVH